MRNVGQAILPAAAFQAAIASHAGVARAGRRLKAGGSHDWLPHWASRVEAVNFDAEGGGRAE
jgi:hypothetical protein